MLAGGATAAAEDRHVVLRVQAEHCGGPGVDGVGFGMAGAIQFGHVTRRAVGLDADKPIELAGDVRIEQVARVGAVDRVTEWGFAADPIQLSHRVRQGRAIEYSSVGTGAEADDVGFSAVGEETADTFGFAEGWEGLREKEIGAGMCQLIDLCCVKAFCAIGIRCEAWAVAVVLWTDQRPDEKRRRVWGGGAQLEQKIYCVRVDAGGDIRLADPESVEAPGRGGEQEGQLRLVSYVHVVFIDIGQRGLCCLWSVDQRGVKQCRVELDAGEASELFRDRAFREDFAAGGRAGKQGGKGVWGCVLAHGGDSLSRGQRVSPTRANGAHLGMLGWPGGPLLAESNAHFAVE